MWNLEQRVRAGLNKNPSRLRDKKKKKAKHGTSLRRSDGNAAPHLLTQVEIDHANGLLGMVIFVVLQHVGVARQTATAKNKPPLLPCLQGEHTNKGKGYFVRFEQ